MDSIERECPHCESLIELVVQYWNTETECPICKKGIAVDYDFQVLDDGDEWPFWNLTKLETETK